MPGSNDQEVTISSSALSQIGVFYRNLKTGSGFANKNWIEMGHGYQEMARDPWLERIHPDDRARVSEQFTRHVRGETPAFHCEYRVRSSDGQWRLFMSSGVVETRDDDGTPLVYVGHDADITEFDDLREALESARIRAENQTLEAEALRSAGAVVVSSLDAPTAVRSVIQQLKLLVPFEIAVVCEVDDRQLRLVGGSGTSPEADWIRFSTDHDTTVLSTLRSRGPNLLEHKGFHLLFLPLITRGNTVGLLVLERAGEPFSGEPLRLAMSMADYIGLALANARLYSRMQQRAEIDQLSGLLTRRAFMETGESVVDESYHAGSQLACLLVDIDKFKSINDTLGHPAGDQVIRVLGGIMRETLRGSDLIARYGGEEFSALLPETTVHHGVEVADRLRSAVESADFPGVHRTVTVSIGVAGWANPSVKDDQRADRLSVEQLLKRADEALYEAKHGGRNRVVRANPRQSASPPSSD